MLFYEAVPLAETYLLVGKLKNGRQQPGWTRDTLSFTNETRRKACLTLRQERVCAVSAKETASLVGIKRQFLTVKHGLRPPHFPTSRAERERPVATAEAASVYSGSKRQFPVRPGAEWKLSARTSSCEF